MQSFVSWCETVCSSVWNKLFLGVEHFVSHRETLGGWKLSHTYVCPAILFCNFAGKFYRYDNNWIATTICCPPQYGSNETLVEGHFCSDCFLRRTVCICCFSFFFCIGTRGWLSVCLYFRWSWRSRLFLSWLDADIGYGKGVILSIFIPSLY